MRRLPSLPEEIIEENILTRLPVKSISRFRCVSRNWNLLFRNPNFIKSHLNHAILTNKFNILVPDYGAACKIPGQPYLYSIDNDVLSSSLPLGHAVKIDYPCMATKYTPEIIGSCNGLICIESTSTSICIWNPATREYKQVTDPSADSHRNFSYYGFGFDSKNGDYKVLRIEGIHSFEEGDVFGAKIYSLASNSWKNLGTVPYNFHSYSEGLPHNGVLYFTGLKSRVIVCFHISDETFHEVPFPKNNSVEKEVVDMSIWEGKLCILYRNQMENHIDVWTLMDNKWSKHLKITTHITDMYLKWPIQTLQNGEILFAGDCFLFYDPNLESARALKIHGFTDVSDGEAYVETLVALNSDTYV